MWTHMGLGDQISVSPTLKAIADSGRTITLIAQPQYVSMVESYFGNHENLDVMPIPMGTSPLRQRKAVYRIAAQTRLPLLTAGHEVYALLARAFPTRSINWHLNASFGIAPKDLLRDDAELLMSLIPQAPVPAEPYAFVDHHPGSPREIPPQILESIQDRGMTLVHNPTARPLPSLLRIMHHASELHLVSSAPLCQALTFDLANGRGRFRYRIGDHHPLLLDYPPDWLEIALIDGQPLSVDRIEETNRAVAAVPSWQHHLQNRIESMLQDSTDS